MFFQLAVDLLHPSPASERRKHKLKRLVPHPNSYFMDVKCPGCYKITTVFSHAQRVVVCAGCSTILCQPTGGRARLTEGKPFEQLSFFSVRCESFILPQVHIAMFHCYCCKLWNLVSVVQIGNFIFHNVVSLYACCAWNFYLMSSSMAYKTRPFSCILLVCMVLSRNCGPYFLIEQRQTCLFVLFLEHIIVQNIGKYERCFNCSW